MALELRSTIREEVDELISSAKTGAAALRLRELWRNDPGPATAAFVTSRFEKLSAGLSLTPCRLAVLRSFTVEPVLPILRASAFCSGIDLTVRLGDFNAYALELLDQGSWLYSFAPDVVLLAARTADVAPDLWTNYGKMNDAEVGTAVKRVRGSFQQWVQAFRQTSQASLILHNLEQPIRPALGVLDAQRACSQADAVRQVNDELRHIASTSPGVYVLDYDALLARTGRLRWHDERKWLTTRMPIAADQLLRLSQEWLRFLSPLTGKLAKAVVVDLDNTLWGGVIGEDGMSGIKLGIEYPGAAYQALQRALLDLAARGILLAICSKNNIEDAVEVLDKHPGMILRPSHFAAMRINWNDKAQGLCEIAAELNIGTEALAFLDDNPVEREQIRSALPEVTVIELPPDAIHYADALRDCPAFERLTLSTEDQQRTSMYAEQRQRAQAEQSFQSKEDFFRFLQQETEVSPVSPSTLARVTQLTQKTNQFNLTTRRYSEAQIVEIAARPDWQVLSISVRDRFGDHGLVGVAITHDQGDVCSIDTFLLSCRVIGRTVETAFLSCLAQAATNRGRHFLRGWFLPTRKNAPARDFFQQHGFQLQSENGEDAAWILDLRHAHIACPDWIKCTHAAGGKI